MSYIGKRPLTLFIDCSITCYIRGKECESSIVWDYSIDSRYFPSSAAARKEANLITFSGPNGSFSSEVPEGFFLKAYPKEAFKFSEDMVSVRVIDQNGAYIQLSSKELILEKQKGPQRRKKKKQSELWGTVQRSLQIALSSSRGPENLSISLKGLGYKAYITEKNHLLLKLGFSHSVELAIPKTVKVNVSTEVSGSDSQLIVLSGYNRQDIGSFGAIIRDFRPPEPYKGKGVLWQTSHAQNKLLLRRKVGKEGN